MSDPITIDPASPADTEPLAAGETEERPKCRLLIKQNWGDEWQPAKDATLGVDWLWCDECTRVAAPSMSSAKFVWQYGQIIRPGQTTAVPLSPLDLIDWFVKVEHIRRDDETPELLGIYVFAADPRKVYGDQLAPTGDQDIEAFGLEYLLDRVTLSSAWIANDPVDAAVSHAELKIDTVPCFNDRYERGFYERGNRSDDPIERTGAEDTLDDHRQFYVFSEDGAVWNSHDILDYLLAHADQMGVRFSAKMDADVAEAMLSIQPPRLDLAGHTMRQALNKLIDRRRGLGWRIEFGTPDSVFPNNETVYVRVFTLTDTQITVGSTVIPANADVITLDVGGCSPEDVRTSTDTTTAYGKIHVIGERIKVCFSLSFTDGTLARGWTDDEQTAYNTLALTAIQNDLERETDKFRHVYTTFIPVLNGSWQVGDGEGLNTDTVANITVSEGGNPNRSLNQPIRNWGHARTLERQLPILKAWARQDVKPEFREPFVVMKHPTQTDTWIYADKHADPDLPAAHVRMLDTDMGFELNYCPNHACAAGVFSGVSQHQAKLNYNQMIATVCAQLDARVRVDLTIEGNEPTRELTIDVPDAHYWYIVPHTVLDVKNGALDRIYNDGLEDNPRVARSDFPLLQSIAAGAQVWFGKKRAKVKVVRRQIQAGLLPGMFVAALNDADGNSVTTQDVGTAITEVIWNFTEGTTVINTNFAELDFGLRY